MAFKENLNMAMSDESLLKETRLQQAMPDILIEVEGILAYMQVVRDRVEKSLESIISIVSTF